MQHIDEHTIELYVLEAKEVAETRSKIARHLRSCSRCKTLHDDIAKFYSEFSSEMEKNRHLGERNKNALIRRVSDRIGSRLYDDVTRYYESLTSIERFQRFVGRNAVPASIGVFGLLAILLFFLLSGRAPNNPEKDIADANPAYVHINKGASVLEVYDKKDQKLWDIPGVGLDRLEDFESSTKIYFTAIADLYHDNKTEVITCLQNLAGEASNQASLRIYDGNKHLLHETDLNQKRIMFRGREYDAGYNTSGLVVNRYDTGKGPTISIGMSHHMRSPYYLVCLDSQGKILGEYWHFGRLVGIYSTRLKQTQKEELLLCGINDMNDNVPGGSFPTIVVLDPSRVIGKTESLLTQGFGFSSSDAELLYIRFPLCDIDTLLKLTPGFSHLIGQMNEELHFVCNSGEPSTAAFEYAFSKDMRVLYVRTTNQTMQEHDMLVKEGRLKGALDQKYLENLKNAVRYWDGKEWRKEVTTIHHTQ